MSRITFRRFYLLYKSVRTVTDSIEIPMQIYHILPPDTSERARLNPS